MFRWARHHQGSLRSQGWAFGPPEPAPLRGTSRIRCPARYTRLHQSVLVAAGSQASPAATNTPAHPPPPPPDRLARPLRGVLSVPLQARFARQGWAFGPPEAAPLRGTLAHRCASARYTRCNTPTHPPPPPPDRFARPLRGVLSVRSAFRARYARLKAWEKAECPASPESTRTRELSARASPGTRFCRRRNAGSGNPVVRPLVPKAASPPLRGRTTGNKDYPYTNRENGWRCRLKGRCPSAAPKDWRSAWNQADPKMVGLRPTSNSAASRHRSRLGVPRLTRSPPTHPHRHLPAAGSKPRRANPCSKLRLRAILAIRLRISSAASLVQPLRRSPESLIK